MDLCLAGACGRGLGDIARGEGGQYVTSLGLPVAMHLHIHLILQACDHQECALEWFHYECVGLTAAPVGEWLCPDCLKAKGAAA